MNSLIFLYSRKDWILMREKDCSKLEFNTYCIFSKEKQTLEETIDKMFKDYIESALKQKIIK